MTAPPTAPDWPAVHARVLAAYRAGDWTLRALARESGVAYGTLSEYLRDTPKRPGLDLDTLARLCQALALDWAAVLTGRGAAPTLPVDALHPSDLNPRKSVDAAALAELAASVATHGVLQPLTVRPRDPDDDAAGYWIVFGERRWRAARAAGLAEVPVTLRDDLDDAAHLTLALVENHARQDVNPMEDAEGLARLAEALTAAGTPADEVTRAMAERIGATQRHVQQRLKLARDLTGPAKDALRAGAITAAQARALARHDAEAQAYALHQIRLGNPGWDTEAALAARLKARHEAQANPHRKLRDLPAPTDPAPVQSPPPRVGEPAPADGPGVGAQRRVGATARDAAQRQPTETTDPESPAPASPAPAGGGGGASPPAADLPPAASPTAPAAGHTPAPSPPPLDGSAVDWRVAGEVGAKRRVGATAGDAAQPQEDASDDERGSPPAPAPAAPDAQAEADAARLAQLLPAASRTALRLLVAALLQPDPRVAVQPAPFSARRSAAGRDDDVAATLRQELDALRRRLVPGAQLPDAPDLAGDFQATEHTPPEALQRLLAWLVAARVGPADPTGGALLRAALTAADHETTAHDEQEETRP